MYGPLDTAADDATIVVSEIVTNSVRAHCQEVTLAIEGHHTHVTFEATDDAPGWPTLGTSRSDASHGRGLVIVDALCGRWGLNAKPNGRKTVWAELPVPRNTIPTFGCADRRNSLH